MSAYDVATISVDGRTTPLESAGPFTLVVDRPVAVRVTSDYPPEGAPSTPIEYEVDLAGDASAEELDRLLRDVDDMAEIPKSLREGTEVRLVRPA